MAKGKRRRDRNTRRGRNGIQGTKLGRGISRGIDPNHRGLSLEPLEDRRLLAVFPVVNALDIEDPDNNGEFTIVAGSLRDAITQANATEEFDTIVFTGAAFEDQIVINLFSDDDNFGELTISNPLQIVGPGPSKLTIIAAPNKRVFLVDDEGEDSLASVSISGMRLQGTGRIAGDDGDGRGGLILNREILELDTLELGGGLAPSGGGAIFNDTGRLTIDRSLIVDNTSEQGGGGIQNGLVDSQDNLPTTTIRNSTITGNTAIGILGEMGVETGFGGGVLNLAGTVDIVQSTIYGNSTSYDGGGIASQGFDPELDDDDMPTVMEGNATTTIISSIIVGNTIPGEEEPQANDVASIGMTEEDLSGDEPMPAMPFEPQIDSDGYNFFGALTHPSMTISMGVTLPGDGTEDMDDIDPKDLFIDNEAPMDPVALLGDFGGDTRVFLLDPNKTAGAMGIDSGNPEAGPGSDQRGRHFTRIFPDMGVIDRGASEFQDGIFIVDTLLDESDGEFETIGDFSLREAIEFSEKNPNRDLVQFSANLRNEVDQNPFTPAPTIVLTEGALTVSQGVDIVGPPFQLEVDASGSSRIFEINDGDALNEIDVTITNLTLANGGGAVNGGAILNHENLALTNSYVLGGFAALNGGGIYIQDGTVTIDSSTFFDNSAANNGGAIYVAQPSNGDGTIPPSNPERDPVLDIVNSTISANLSSNRGAGLANFGTNTAIRHSTFTLNNSASTRASGVANLGDGQLNVYSSIIAGNLNNDIESFGGPITNINSSGFNLIGVGNAESVFFDTLIGDRNGIIDPKLAPLAFAGGPTPTHRLEGDSLAIDAGELGGINFPNSDQRGEPQFVRVFDSDVDGTAQIDIGAYELQEVTYTVTNATDENDGIIDADNLSLREAIEIANASEDPLPETIVFDQMLFGSEISLNPFLPGALTTPDIRITGPINIIGTGIILNGSGMTTLEGTVPMFTIDDGDDESNSSVRFEGFSFVNSADRAIASKEDVLLDTITATGNSGVVSHSVGTLTIKTSVLTGNTAPDGGGVISVTDGNLEIEGSLTGYGYTLITGNNTSNSQGHGGGISFVDNSADGKSISLNKVIISGNRAPAGDSDGAGVFVSGNGNASAQTAGTIRDSIISGNVTTGSNSEGAGLFSKDADLTLTGVVVSLNKSYGTSSKGAGIYISGGSVTLENSVNGPTLITQNSTYGNYASGAGIANVGGDLTLNQVTISRNTTAGSDTHGGGIYSNSGNLTIDSSTVSENRSTASGFSGGGIYSLNDLAGTKKTTIFNSTVSGNSATHRGGGVYNAGGLVEVKYSTISNNSVPYFGNGGGLASLGNAATQTTLRSSIVAGNHATQDPANSITDVDVVNGLVGSIDSLDFNLVGVGLPLAVDAINMGGDQVIGAADPGLASLTTTNGGATATHALLPTSLAINAGDPNAVAGVGDVPNFDQRGTGFTRVFGGLRIDVGAYESDLAPISTGPDGDFDGDNDVDGSDFLTWQIGFGITSGAAASDGDANSDGAVNGLDLAIWTNNFGSNANGVALAASSTSGGSALAASVSEASEPSSGAAVLSSNELSAGLLYEPIAVSSGSTDKVVETNSVAENVGVRDQLFASLTQRGEYRPPLSTDGVAEETSEDDLKMTVEDQVFASLGA